MEWLAVFRLKGVKFSWIPRTLLESLQHSPSPCSWWGVARFPIRQKNTPCCLTFRPQAAAIQALIYHLWHQPPPLEKFWVHYLSMNNLTTELN